jgi:hypothetical protein
MRYLSLPRPIRSLHQHLDGIKDICFYLGIPILLFMFMHFSFEIAKQTIATAQVVEQLDQDQAHRDKAVQDLKDDNAHQTLLMCKIFLTGQIELSDQDTVIVEDICRDRITKLSQPQPQATTAPSGQQSAEPSHSSVATPGQSGTMPVKEAPQSSPTPVKRVQNTLDDILNVLNPLN